MASTPSTPGFSRTVTAEGYLQLYAGVGFIDSSMLLNWDLQANRFVKRIDGFEAKWPAFDPAFGRAAFWNIFSTGAECLLKAFYLCHGIEIRTVKKNEIILPGPSNEDAVKDADIDEWVSALCAEVGGSDKKVKRRSGVFFGTLGDLQQAAMRDKVMGAVVAEHGEQMKSKEQLLWAAFQVLASTIRNRDTHAYVPNVRQNHYFVLEKLMLPAFNQILDWLPKAQLPQQVSQQWMAPEGNGTGRSGFVLSQHPTVPSTPKKQGSSSS